MFLEACWRAATDDLIASDKWIKSELSAIKDEEIRTLLKELLIDHTGRQAKVLTRSIFKDIYRKARTTIFASRPNVAITIGRAPVCTPVTYEQLVCLLSLE